MPLADLIADKKKAVAEAGDEDFAAGAAVDTPLDFEDEPTPAPKPERKPKPKKAPVSGSAAADAVEEAMNLLDDDQAEDVSGDDDDVVAPVLLDDGIEEERLAKIKRPNGEDYTPRVIGDKTDVELLRDCADAHIPVLMGGYPGCGKTAMAEAAFGEDLITVEGHGDMEVTDLIGNWIAKPDGGFEWVDGPLTRAMGVVGRDADGQPIMGEGKKFLLDDCTLIPAPVLARMYPVMDGRGTITITEHKGEKIKAAPGFAVVGAHNPGAPGAILSEALASRFLVHVEVESDLSLAKRMGINRRVIAAAKNMRKQRKEGTVTWAPEMRELLGYKRVARTLGPEIALNNLLSIAPEDARETLQELLQKILPDAEPLRIANDD